MGLIYEPVTKVKLFVRYTHYDVLKETSREIDDCFADTIPMFRDVLLRNPGLASAVRYGKKVREDVIAKVILEWTDQSGFTRKQFDDVYQLVAFLNEHPALSKALEYVPRPKP